MKIDNLDLEIIKNLQQDARLSFRELGRKLNVPHTTVFTRAERLLERGIIKNFSAVLHPHDLGLQIGFIVVDTSAAQSKETAWKLAGFDEVRKVYRTFDGLNNILKIFEMINPGPPERSPDLFFYSS